MPFIRKKVTSYKWPVKVESPSVELPGTFDIQEFTAVFKQLGRAAISKLVEVGDKELLEAALVGWEEIEDEKGEAISFTKANKIELIDDTHVSKAVIKSLLESLEGAPAKN